MVALLQRKKKQENTRRYCVDTYGRICNPDNRYGVLQMSDLEAIRDLYFSGGPDAALLKYQDLVLQFESDIRKRQQELADGRAADGSIVSM